MFTPSARAAFHRLAARAHERAATLHTDGSVQLAQDRTDEAWSASFGPDGDRSCGAHGEEQEAAADASEDSECGRHWASASAHRRAAEWAKAARA